MPKIVRLLLTGLGVAGLILGFYLGITLAGEARSRATRAAALTQVDARTLANKAPGAEVLMEGTLSTANLAHFRDFVAYVRYEFRGTDEGGRQRWVEDERLTPQLLVEAGGPVLVVNEGYELLGRHRRWQEPELNWNSAVQEGTKRYNGLLAERPVLLIGRAVERPQQAAVAAEFVFAGTREQYLAVNSRNAGRLPWYGLGFGLFGAVCAYFGLWGLRRWK